MSNTALITLNNVHLAYGHHPLLDGADLSIQSGERIGLIGRNGTGKSSLLKLLDGRNQPDDGSITTAGHVRVATVEQEPELDDSLTIEECIMGEFDPEDEDWQRASRVRALIDKLGLPAQAHVAGLSGGMRKRVALIRAMASQPNLLLLDEPTNHLDMDGILWLESTLRQWPGSAVIITHDRRFLDAIATRIIELDRGKLLSFPGNFSEWQTQKAQWLEAQRLENARFDKLLAQEEIWIRKGVEARRTRSVGRVKRLEQMRKERAERRDRQGNVNLAVDAGQRSGKLVAELEHVSKSFGDHCVVRDYSTTIMRGDRIGLIGPNGAGKSTLLKLILGTLQPDSGTVKLGTNLSVAYFDQMRSQLDENATLADIINPGSEWIEIGGTKKHVMSYLGDFLFAPARAQSPVSSLSGGERARLLLARLFARPANILVLDEPTNDLDIETLELLEELLQDYPGTVLLVSHDRTFLDNVVTQTIASEGDGIWKDYVGGYLDWERQQKPQTGSAATDRPKSVATATSSTEVKPAPTQSQAKARANKLAPWEVKELEQLPAAINALEEEQSTLVTQMGDSSLYKDDPNKLTLIQNRLKEIDDELAKRFARWELLEARNS
ncbi:ATP-binding cassette domain-containing protein [Orrella sp. NBD-18]|uniref:ATP-binding protein Uup n=1 Tax=Sheuella amnicola TaxID=2707330 RepID=A0A6B2QXZ7_9BURK|nr:ATP-binding cassette domain-containing protein [Sheuella amnicola]NDY82891.1 ATP-binding cassette domain-containing protein [Sheuella amnicola]